MAPDIVTRSPFLDPDDPSLAAMIGDGAVHLLVDRGIGELSSRALAGYLGITPPALTQQACRAEQLRLLVVALGRRWLDWSDLCGGTGLPARLPEDEAELHGVRVWGAVAELVRGEETRGNAPLAALLGEFRREERAQLSWRLAELLDRRPHDDAVTSTGALVAGLRQELTSPDPSVSYEEAARILREHVDGLAPPA